jgi:hypothetical protein
MRYIKLKDNYFVMVDDEDYERISQIKWSLHDKTNKSLMIYARSTKKYGSIYMHRFIMNANKDQKIDHINGNGLDNRKENLRFATHQENNFNKKPYENNQCGYKGVRQVNNRSKPYIATITYNALARYIGSYYTVEEAAKAYDKKATELFGEFAYLNFPQEFENG